MENLTGLLVDKVLREDLDFLETKDILRDCDFPPGVNREAEVAELREAVEALEGGKNVSL